MTEAKSSCSRVFLLLLGVAALMWGSAPVAFAQINTSINQSVWQMQYGLNSGMVSTATWNSWLANQLPAGTNPMAANSQLAVSTFSISGPNVLLMFPTVLNKSYQLQTTSSLNPANWTNVGAAAMGTGSNMTLSGAKTAGTYFKVIVQDVSTAGDGVSDWAKSFLGYTPGMNINSQSSYTAPTLATALSTQNTVTLSATDPTATQPASPNNTTAFTLSTGNPCTVTTTAPHGLSSGTTVTFWNVIGGTFSPAINNTPFTITVTGPTTFTILVNYSSSSGINLASASFTSTTNDLAVITISRAGYQSFNSITVPLQISGTAVAGVDYTALPTSVTFPTGVNSVPLYITPLYNPNQFSTGTVIVTAQAGGGYTLGTPSAASILIYPNVVPAGTGLTGSYFTGVSTAISNLTLGNPCTVTTSTPHGLATTGTTSVIISGVTGGTFSSPINATFNATYVNSTTFTISDNYSSNTGINLATAVMTTYAPLPPAQANLGVGVASYNYTKPSVGQAIVTYSGTPTTAISNLTLGNPCTVTTSAPHGLSTGNNVVIAGVSGGTFSTPIDATFPVTVTSATTFTIPDNYSNSSGIGLTNAVMMNTLVNLQFLTGSLAGGTFDTNYNITALAPPAFKVLVPGPNASSGGTAIVYPFNPPTATKLDPTVDFTWGTTTSPATGIAAGSAFTVRWTGQVLATFTEPYFFSVKGTQGCKLWVNGQKILDKWQSQAVTDQVSSAINLQAGVFYDIKLEYLATAGNANEVHLQWYNNDFPEQVIPTSNLYPNITGFGSSAAAAVTSPVTVAYVLGSGSPFSYTISGSNATSTFSVSNLPLLSNGLPWLTLTGNTVSGTPPAAGTYQFTVTTTNSGGSSSAVVTLNVISAPGTITRETWTSLSGANVSNIPTTTAPSSTDTTLNNLEDTAAYGNNTGERLRGYFTAPTTGNYYFWIAGTNAGELWISDDNQKVNLVKRASFSSSTGSRIWNNQTSQQSPWLSLVAGQNYYFEVLHNTGSTGSSSYLSVAWAIDPTGSSALIGNGAGPAQPGNGVLASTGGIVPAAELWPWDNPTTTNTTGSIYLANLAPIAGLSVPSKASGGAYLSVNGSTGLLHLNYSGITSPVTWRRIYTGPVGSPTLLFDLDAQDKSYPALKTSDGAYTWTISNLSTLTSGQAYLKIATLDNPTGEISGSFAFTAGSQTPPAAPSYPTWTNDSNTVGGASRFLSQASFGPGPTDLTYIQSNSSYSTNAGYGYRAWLEQQFGVAPSLNESYALAQLADNPSDPYPDSAFFTSWWKHAVTAPDQLRQRIAFALSEIVVTSDSGSSFNNNSRALASYYDTLLNDAFTNFNTILQDVTLSATMGSYLNMEGNAPGNNQTGLHPNENYAREIMQLFSIGLYRLWPDGTLVLDASGAPIPTYNQNVITGMAAVMTGWSWGQAIQSNGRLPTQFFPGTNWLDPMVLVPNDHQLTSKIVLDNAVLPAAVVTSSSSNATGTVYNPSASVSIQYTDATLGQGNLDTATVTKAYDLNGLIDLQTALGMLSNHANVGPFICRQLIQRLVESNPSPAYIYRVVRAFNGQYNIDGQATGVVGDMKDTIRAILLDPEARDSAAAGSSTTFGKQREPLLRFTGPARAFRSTTIVNGYPNSTYREIGGQAVLITTPSVHNLTNGDTVQLDNISDTIDNPPAPLPSQGYSVNNATSSYTVSGTTCTISSPGYQVNDTVWIQFISGALGTSSTYNGLAQYPVTAATGSNFTITVASGFDAATGNCITPYNFVINNVGSGQSAYQTNSGGTTLTVSLSDTSSPPNYPVNTELYLTFTSGALSGGAYNGLYTIATNTGVNCTVTPLASGAGGPSNQGNPWPVSASGFANWPQFTLCGCTVTTNGVNQSTLTIQTGGSSGATGGNNNLIVGDSVYLNFRAVNAPPVPTNGVYQVATILAPNEFTVTVNSVLTAGGTAGNSLLVFPLNSRQLNRSGTATINLGTFTLGNTDSDISQTPMNSPSVFNYFYPSFSFPGAIANAGLTTPEFQLTNASNTMTLTNTLSTGVLGSGNTYGFTSLHSTNGTVVMDLRSYATAAQTADPQIASLVQTLATLLGGVNGINSNTQSLISSYITGSVKNNTGFGLSTGNPCTVSTTTPHGLSTGTSVTFANVSGGTFSPAINNTTFTITVTSPTTFTIPVNYSNSSGINLGGASFTSTTLTNQVALARVRAIIQLIIISAEYAIQQ